MRMQGTGCGIAFAVGAVACFAAYDTGAKLLSGSVTIVLLLWTRYLLQVVWVGVTHRAGAGIRQTRVMRLHFTRAVCLLVCNVMSFYSFKYLPVADVTAIAMLVPLLLTAFAAFVLKERVGWVRWLLVCTGLLGALLIVRPGAESTDIRMLLPIGFVLSYALFQLITSKLVSADSADTVMFYTSAVGFTAMSCLMPLAWQGMPPLTLTLQIVLVASLSSVGHHLLVMAYRHAATSVISPYLYFQLVFACLGGALVFGEVPDALAAVGAGVIAASGVLSALINRERRAVVNPG